MKADGAMVEVFQGVLKHYMVFPDGDRVQMGEPVVAEVHMPYINGGGVVPGCHPAYCVDRIFDLIRERLMEKYNEL